MRSFIKSHRKSESLERNNGNGITDSVINTSQQKQNQIAFTSISTNTSQRSSYELCRPLSSNNNGDQHTPTTPSQYVQNDCSNNNNTKGHLHSPSTSFESLHHRLTNKKMFTSKLFKKTSNSNLSSHILLNNNNNNISNNNDTYTYTIEKNINNISNTHSKDSLNDLISNKPPSIKGTMTHSWGIDPDEHIYSPSLTRKSSIPNLDYKENLITLNEKINNMHLNDDNNNNNNNNNNINSNTHNNTNLEPPIKLSSSSASSQLPRTPSSSSSSTSFTSNSIGPNTKQNISSNSGSITIKKIRNRKARIHSDDDVINLSKDSSFKINLNSLKKTPAKLNLDDPSDINNHNNTIRIPSITFQEASPIKERTSITHSSSTQNNKTSNSRLKLASNNNNSDYEDSINDFSFEANDEGEETGTETDTDTGSEFSFEYGGINGRTSSMKYYSKPEESPDRNGINNNSPVYIDDLYEDENFDEDMNYFEDDDEDNNVDEDVGINESHYAEQQIMKVSANDFEPNTTNKKGKIQNYNSLFDISDDNDESETGEMNKIKKYDDFFDLTDDADDNDDTEGDVDRNVQIKEQNVLPTKPIKKYNDLFELSDDDHDDEDNNNADDNSTTKNESHHAYQDNMNISENPKMLVPTIKLTASQPLTSNSKKITKYKDLFELSDEDEDGHEDENPETQDLEESLNTYSISENIKAKHSPLPQSISTGNFDESIYCNKPKSTRINQSTTSSRLPNKSGLHQPLLSSHLTDVPLDSDTPKTPLESSIGSFDKKFSNRTPLSSSNQSTSLFLSSPNLPPPARSQTLKYHDLNCDLDAEVPGLMSNLYFIDETEEDEYNEKTTDNRYTMMDTSITTTNTDNDEDYYLDEINVVPEDFNFSDTDDDPELNLRSPLRRRKFLYPVSNTQSSLSSSISGLGSLTLSPSSFRRTHSYHSKPIGVSRENTPISNKLELNNKTVTFFHHPWSGATSNSNGTHSNNTDQNNFLRATTNIKRVRSPKPLRSSSLGATSNDSVSTLNEKK
ncbi:Zrg8p NDAI_0B06060 [Naumovozyma dairenensis CBS 421]|uniref:Zinc-regulated protein 8 n=1 Tax=Naumovozyma dairenensis (strain ATCC 10597 / BCRC 20456 / CBS 421 / NBRC 0211 / NRRL Y-12639) TaxID=1071378 RepID=G0W777_NAUDC|nr:hypothetical protein NDAI_0B06060 [Naumovozyma dairenensis CBS 421]CCD23638.1 hypothetical protein NDAI_0B06060 [Naumovozyma dairenensis CBS 421]